MAIGRHQPKTPVADSTRGVLAALLAEALTGLEESFHDLTDDQIAAECLTGRHNIATLIMHVLETVDDYACAVQSGQHVLEHEDRFDVWSHSRDELRDRQGDLPTVADIVERLRQLQVAAEDALRQATDEGLLRIDPARGGWMETGRSRAAAYLRLIGHIQAHVRQIWLMRGVMGLTDREGWPEQHLA